MTTYTAQDEIMSSPATTTPLITLDLTDTGPLGSHGFRRGLWSVIVDGRRARVYLSVPHQLPLGEQHARVLSAAAQAYDMGALLFSEGGADDAKNPALA